MRLKSIITVILWLSSLWVFSQFSPAPKCTIKMGDNYFTNMQHLIVCGGKPICDISSRSDSILINLVVHDKSGNEIGKIIKSKLVSGNKNDLSVKYSASEFSVTHVPSKQQLCLIKKSYLSNINRCILDLWLNFYLPNGKVFQCTPQTSNQPKLQQMSGVEMDSMGTAIVID